VSVAGSYARVQLSQSATFRDGLAAGIAQLGTVSGDIYTVEDVTHGLYPYETRRFSVRVTELDDA
jgi:hypothetical protein